MRDWRRQLAATSVLVAMAGSAGALAGPVAAQDTGEYETTEGLSQPIYGESVTEVYRIGTEHGTIYGEVIRPVVPEGTLVPVILTYSPYNILGSPSNQAASIADDSLASFYVPRGYARAVFDVVGTRESSGCYDYGGIRERETGRDVVNALGEFEWSNGKVGMIGGSYDGTTQFAAAIENPEHLTTIIPQVAIDRWYDYAYGGGIRYFLNSENPSDEGFDTPLAFDFGFGFIPPLDVTNPETYGEALADRINPCERVDHTQRAYDPDPVYDEFWDERDYRKDADKVTASVFIEGGWLDHNVKHWDSTRFFMALPDDHPKKLVMGQWNHSASRFGDAASIRHAWFDYWLLGLETGVMRLPAVDTQLNTGERVQEDAWPPVGTIEATFPLLADGSTDAGQFQLRTGSDATWTDANKQLTEEQAFDQGCLVECIEFTTEPLEVTTRISGSPRLDMLAVTDGAETHFTPVLFDEDASGARQIITRGFLNARNRDGLDVSEPLSAGTPYEASIEFWDVDWELAAGHRIGILMMSSNAAWVLPDISAATTSLTLDGATTMTMGFSRGGEAFGVAPAPVEPVASPAPEPAPAPEPSPAPLPATGGGLLVAGLATAALGRTLRRR